MSKRTSAIGAPRFLLCLSFICGMAPLAQAALLTPVPASQWRETHVRRVISAFAYGGLASDAQIQAWAQTGDPRAVVREMLTFAPTNERLSPAEDANAQHCGAVSALQALWSSDDADNRMRYDERHRYAVLNADDKVSESNFQRAWSKAVGLRGCNPFLHKVAVYLTNYHAAVSYAVVEPSLVGAYYDDVLEGLARGDTFAELMYIPAAHPAFARQYSHQYSRVSAGGTLYSNDDFAREYLQLLFRINGITEKDDYHENVSIENNARLLTGMNIDREHGAYGRPLSRTGYIAPIDFSDHTDATGRYLPNTRNHNAGCLEILHESICGEHAGEKLAALGEVAIDHPESMDNLPVSIATWFGDDRLTRAKQRALRGSWQARDHDLLDFLRDYAASTQFHSRNTVKYKSVFDRTLGIQNAHVLTNEELFARDAGASPNYRIEQQGVQIFRPIRSVFGHQTGLDAANDRHVFKSALGSAIEQADYLYDAQHDYTLDAGAPARTWRKDWQSIIPTGNTGVHRVSDVGLWLWRRFVGDNGRNFDKLARVQVHSLLATGYDFGYALDPDNAEHIFTADDMRQPAARRLNRLNWRSEMDLASDVGKHRVGMAINFITMTPFTFAMEGK